MRQVSSSSQTLFTFVTPRDPTVKVQAGNLSMNWFQELSLSLHPLVHCRSLEVCLSKWTWETLWIYLILQAIRLSRALLNMTWSVPAPEQTLLSPWPARAVISWGLSWDLTAVAFLKQITAVFCNTVRPLNLALTKTRARVEAANAPANVLPACVCAHFLLSLYVCVCLQCLIHFLFVFSPPHWMVQHSDAPISLCFLMLFFFSVAFVCSSYVL